MGLKSQGIDFMAQRPLYLPFSIFGFNFMGKKASLAIGVIISLEIGLWEIGKLGAQKRTQMHPKGVSWRGVSNFIVVILFQHLFKTIIQILL